MSKQPKPSDILKPCISDDAKVHANASCQPSPISATSNINSPFISVPIYNVIHSLTRSNSPAKAESQAKLTHRYLSEKLFKYKPNTTKKHIERYCVATDTYFLCYSNEWAAFSPTFKPLAQIPYSDIEKVEKYRAK